MSYGSTYKPRKMPARSEKNLRGVYPPLAHTCRVVNEYYPIIVLVGRRGREEQEEAFRTGKSKVRYPNSKHNANPSLAVDIVPNPIPHRWGKHWKDRVFFYEAAAIFRYEAARRNMVLRIGNDWDMDRDYKDNKFDDLGHIEVFSINGRRIHPRKPPIHS